MKKQPQRLIFEQLEDRTVPANWGVAWPGADHLKVSFVPDGTLVDGSPSGLFQQFDGQTANGAWKTEILRALQTWAVNANINLGLVSDGGQAIGSAGPAQGSPNFGDIRVASRPMGTDVVALTSPFDVSTGTRSGDMIFNSASALGVGSEAPYDLFTVALHEAAHVFGLSDNLNSTSVLYRYYQGVRTGLGAADIALLQQLSGTRTPDSYEGVAGNDSLALAAVMNIPEAAADVRTNSDPDFFRYVVPNYADSTVTITVRTSGISLLTPRLTVYDANGQALATASSTDPLHNDVTISLQDVQRGTELYLKVEGARGDVFGVGGYRLKIDSGAVSQAQIQAIDATLEGTVLRLPSGQTPNDTMGNAADLNQLSNQSGPNTAYWISAGLSATNTAGYYKIVAPPATANGPQTMIAGVSRIANCVLNPQITVYDAQGNRVNAEILANDHGSYAVQVAGATPGATYDLLVSPSAFAADTANRTGDYVLGVQFQDKPITLQTCVNDALTDSARVDVVTLDVNQSQFLQLALSVNTGVTGGTVATAVRMNIYNDQGILVLSLDAQDGELVSKSIFLKQGRYAVRFVAATRDGLALPNVSYNLRGRMLTDPQDPVPIDPTFDPTHPPSAPPPIVVSTTTLPPTLPPLDPTSEPWTPPPTIPPG